MSILNQSDPLLRNLPLSQNPNELIEEVLAFLGYDLNTFDQILASLLIEEMLDRLILPPERIEALRLQSDHIRKVKEYLDETTGLNWSVKASQEFWKRIRKLDSNFRREPIPLSRKLQVLATRPHTCEFCGLSPPEVSLQVDHIYAASKGGPDDLWNLRLLCSDCNRKKSNRLDWSLL